MPSAAKMAYAPASIGVSVLGGMVASQITKQVWKRVSDKDDTPSPRDLDDYTTKEVLLGAAIQGLIFGLVKASMDRATAKGFQRLTGESPT